MRGKAFRLAGVLLAMTLFGTACSSATTADDSPLLSEESVAIDDHLLIFEVGTFIGENERRVEEFLEAINLLPEHLIDPLNGITIIHLPQPTGCNGTVWASGCVSLTTPQITIHETSNIDAYPYDWEHFAVNGYTNFERVYILVHEIGHLIDLFVLSPEQRIAFGEVRKLEAEAVTSYGNRGVLEDFADAFTFFVLWPDYLAEHTPERFAHMQKIFDGFTYEPRVNMPSSVQSRLAFSWPVEK